MRLHSNAASGDFEVQGLEESTNFSMKVNGKTFKILIDGLYADKIGAVIRELSTNAYDAHLAIGKGDKPFEVQIPTIWDPTFRVRDFGISLTHEQTMRLLSTIFDSTKDTSNNQVGAFGLGSKSPFSLVDAYTLTVWKDGMKRVYSAFFKPDGVPTLALMGKEASTEPQGVEFSMTIQSKDVSAFKSKAERVLRWFPTPPTIKGAQIDLTPPKAAVSGVGWQLLSLDGIQWDDSLNGGKGAHARQGCVVYPIDSAPIPNMSQEHRALLSSPVIIDFPIGSLDVAASREALSYDEQTCKNISARLNAVSKEVIENYGKAIKNAPTLWEAAKKMQELRRDRSLPQALSDIIRQTKWKGTEPVTGGFDTDAIVVAMKRANKDVTISGWYGHQLSPHYSPYRRRKAAPIPPPPTLPSTRPNTHWRFNYGDESFELYISVEGVAPSNWNMRLAAHIVAENKKGNSGTYLMIAAKTEADALEVIEKMGTPPYKRIETLPDVVVPPPVPKAPPKKRGTTQVEQVKVREIVTKGNKTNNALKLEDEKTILLDGDEPFYIFTRQGRAVDVGSDGKSEIAMTEVLRAVEHLNALGVIPAGRPIYTISTTYEKRVTAYQKWTAFTTFAKTLDAVLEKLLEDAMERENLEKILDEDVWIGLYDCFPEFRTRIDAATSGALGSLNAALKKHKLDTSNRTTILGVSQSKIRHLDYYILRNVGIDARTIEKKVQGKINSATRLVDITTASRGCSQAYPLIPRFVGRAYGYSGPHSVKRVTLTNKTSEVVDYIDGVDLLRKVAAGECRIVPTTATTPAAGAAKAPPAPPAAKTPVAATKPGATVATSFAQASALAIAAE